MRLVVCFFFFSSRRRHTRFDCDWSSDVCSSDLPCCPSAHHRGHRLCWADGLLCPGVGVIAAGPIPARDPCVPVLEEKLWHANMPIGSFSAGKRTIINTLRYGSMLLSDAECGWVLRGDTWFCFSLPPEFASNR